MNSLKYDLDFWKVWSNEEMDRQMSPIQWIVNKTKRETIQNHLTFSMSETAKARETVPCKLDISYGPQDNQKLDVYGVDLPSESLTFFWVHGGYWRVGDKSWSGCFVKNAYSRGIKSVVIDYPLAPQARMSDMCNAVSQALEKSMTLLPGSRFVVGGQSAGAQLVSSLFHEIPGVQVLSDHLMDRVIGAVLMSGPYDMRPALELPSINTALQLKPEEATDYTALLTINKLHPGWIRNKNRFEFHISTAEHDPFSIKKFGEMYADMLRKAQFSAEYWISQDDDHFTEVENMAREDSNVAKKLLAFLTSLHAKYGTAKCKL